MDAKISSLEVQLECMGELKDEDWSEECGMLYDFLSQYLPNGLLLDKYHAWSKKNYNRIKYVDKNRKEKKQ